MAPTSSPLPPRPAACRPVPGDPGGHDAGDAPHLGLRVLPPCHRGDRGPPRGPQATLGALRPSGPPGHPIPGRRSPPVTQLSPQLQEFLFFSPHGVDWGGGRGPQRTQASLGPGLGHRRSQTFRHQEAGQGSSRAAPAGTMVGRHGRRKGMEVLPRVSQIPRLIPEKQWYLGEGTEYGGPPKKCGTSGSFFFRRGFLWPLHCERGKETGFILWFDADVTPQMVSTIQGF